MSEPGFRKIRFQFVGETEEVWTVRDAVSERPADISIPKGIAKPLDELKPGNDVVFRVAAWYAEEFGLRSID